MARSIFSGIKTRACVLNDAGREIPVTCSLFLHEPRNGEPNRWGGTIELLPSFLDSMGRTPFSLRTDSDLVFVVLTDPISGKFDGLGLPPRELTQ